MKIIDDITNFIFVEDKPQQADIILIPGGSYSELGERASKLWRDGYSKLILPSGKYSVKRGYFPGPLSKAYKYNKQYQTEWDFLRDVLIQNGVDEASILKEDNSENTYENALYSRKVTDENTLNIKRAIICCKNFHARRCLMYYQLFYPEAELIVYPVETQDIRREDWFKSDNGIEKVMGELMRCGGQFKEMFKDELNNPGGILKNKFNTNIDRD